MPMKAPRKKPREKLPHLIVIIEQGNPVMHNSIEEAFREYKGQNVLIRDSSLVARRHNAYISGIIASLPIDGVYEFKTKGRTINLKREYLMDMLAREEN